MADCNTRKTWQDPQSFSTARWSKISLLSAPLNRHLVTKSRVIGYNKTATPIENGKSKGVWWTCFLMDCLSTIFLPHSVITPYLEVKILSPLEKRVFFIQHIIVHSTLRVSAEVESLITAIWKLFRSFITDSPKRPLHPLHVSGTSSLNASSKVPFLRPSMNLAIAEQLRRIIFAAWMAYRYNQRAVLTMSCPPDIQWLSTTDCWWTGSRSDKWHWRKTDRYELTYWSWRRQHWAANSWPLHNMKPNVSRARGLRRPTVKSCHCKMLILFNDIEVQTFCRSCCLLSHACTIVQCCIKNDLPFLRELATFDPCQS